MNDPVPEHSNRFAVAVGRILHPYLLPIPTLLMMLSGLPFGEALGWSFVVVGLVLTPGITGALFFQRRGRFLYQRQTRGPLYLIGWMSILFCLAVMVFLDAPTVLIASVATLAVWAPLQWAINRWMTKISTHAAVAAGCFTTLLLLGKVGNPLLQILLLILVVLTLWARIVTRNHTIPQVVMGALVGVVCVLLIFPLALP